MRGFVHAVVALLLGALFVLLLEIPGLGATGQLLVSDLGQLLAVVLATVLCWLASRSPHAHARAWRALALGVGSWAAGQLVWTWYEVVLGTEVPFPSLADVGFLLFPILTGVGLLDWLGDQSQAHAAARGRDVLDGAIIAVSLLVLSWVTSLGAAAADSSDGSTGLALSVAYPISDVILGTLVLLAVTRGRSAERPVLLLLALGLGALALADSAYLYLVSLGDYTSADVVSSGWVFGFLLVGAAAALERSRARHPLPVIAGPAHSTPSLVAAALPYIPVTAAGIAVSYGVLTASAEPPVVDLGLGMVLVVLVLGRQFLAMAENQRLYVALGTARDQLEFQALHDALTGLANRALFTDRLDHAMLRSGHDVGLLFCDLDDFKQVNDQHGHDVGDLLLQVVATRLRECVRGQDTVARVGGDEFAVLLEDPEDATQVAERLVARMAEPVELRGLTVQVTVSVGVAHHRVGPAPGGPEQRRSADRSATTGGLPDPGTDPAPAPGDPHAGHGLSGGDLLLRLADQAMYAAKSAGKGRAVLAEEVATTTGS
ncbi:GGDEF domain-containing protein [Nocardioides mesophilus]|uniref:GGDEF domain-containing protein n=1 Tax=Nocardioides mesophilus TaxID=433659 RepID=A0A7G9RFS8_9ACTN|nr:GGDEF domain-containing protein [Nocardioides mesophilus]QNN54453.1 GGDEF domain-containing protein [Nocardioides mesophilus]